MKKILVIQSEAADRSQLGLWLTEQGWHFIDGQDGPDGLSLSLAHSPDVIVCDIATSRHDGLQLCRDIRGHKHFQNRAPRIVLLGQGTGPEKYHALEAGADEYVARPVAAKALRHILEHFSGADHSHTQFSTRNAPSSAVRMKFWGVRGSIPSPGPETVHYGGNTSCVEVRVGSEIIVLDAGSGLRRLGLALTEEFRGRPMELNLLITHTHWDHIQGFPFFLPAYDPKNKVTIFGYEGATQGLQSTLSSQMESPYFPISMRQMPGHITIHELSEMQFKVNSVQVRSKFLNHPGICTGYRLETPGGSISYLPDVELHQRLRALWNADTSVIGPKARQHAPAEDHELVEFIRDSEVLIMDAQYDAEEYEKHVGWGHSCVEDTVAFALQANVKRLFLFHHDPDHTDEHVSRIVARARQIATLRHSSLIIEAAREGFEMVLEPKKT